MSASRAWTAATHSMRRAAQSKLPPRRALTWDKADNMLKYWYLWQDGSSIVHRLPLHYQHRFWSSLLADRTPVHSKPPETRFRYDQLRRVLHENEYYPVEPIYPPEFHQGLWGGEGVVKGYKISKPYTRKKVLPRQWIPRLYFPALKLAVVYSEVLDKYMKVVVTERALRLIDEHFGLDMYLLETADHDLRSKLALKLKREILLRIAQDDYPVEEEEQLADMKAKYDKFKMPSEEAEWVGLDLNEACKKQQLLEEAAVALSSPHKLSLERKVVRQLKQREESEPEAKSGIWGRLFKS